MNEQAMFDVPQIEKKASKFTANSLKAIAWYADNYSLKVELSIPPSVRFTSRELGETYPILLTDVIDEYKQFRKEETKRKAREKKS